MFLNLDKFSKKSLAAIDDSGSSISYGELQGFSNVFDNLIKKRSLLFILSENEIGALSGFVGALVNRVVPLILNSNTDKVLLINLISIYKPDYLWVPEQIAGKFNFKIIHKQYDYCLLETEESLKVFHKDLALLLPTSGTTGSSKLVRHSYRNIEANAKNVAELFNLTVNERPIAILPMYYTMGLSVLTSHLSVGATILLVKKGLLNPEFWRFIKEQRATSFTGVPYSFELLEKLRFTRMNLPDLKIISQGGGKMTEDLFSKFAEYAKQNGKQFIATYGQTECTARMTYLPPELATSKTCSIGIAEPNTELWIIDEDFNRIDEMEASGQMVFKGENVTLGYAYNIDDLNKGDENHGIRYTGDIVRRDKDGCYYVIGRMERFLKLYGFRVGLDECELLIRESFNIECACDGSDEEMIIYITNGNYYDKVVPLLSQKTGVISSAFKVKVLTEIPKNDTGKILYTKLSEISDHEKY